MPSKPMRPFLFLALLFLLIGMFAPVGAQPTGTSYFPTYAATQISTNATTLVLTGSGVLHSICINDQGASSNIATVYNGIDAGGTAIAVIDTVTATGCLVYDAAMRVGITVVTATGTAANLTVTYRALR